MAASDIGGTQTQPRTIVPIRCPTIYGYKLENDNVECKRIWNLKQPGQILLNVYEFVHQWLQEWVCMLLYVFRQAALALAN